MFVMLYFFGQYGTEINQVQHNNWSGDFVLSSIVSTMVETRLDQEWRLRHSDCWPPSKSHAKYHVGLCEACRQLSGPGSFPRLPLKLTS
jgi:hypothetical protein